VSRIEHRAFAGGISGLASFVSTLGIAVLQVPILLRYWPAEAYGTWILVGTVTAFLTVLDLGHQNYVGNLFIGLSVESRPALKIALGSAIRVAFVIGLVQVAVAVCLLAPAIQNWVLKDGAIAWRAQKAGWATCLYLCYWAIFSSVGGVLVRLYLTNQLFARGQWLGTAMRVGGFVSLVASVGLGANLLTAMLVSILANVILNIGMLWDLRRRLPDLFPWWQSGDWLTGWTNLCRSTVLMGNGILEQIGMNGLIIVIGRFAAPLAIAAFTTQRTVANVAIQAASILMTPLLPELVRYHIGREPAKVTAVLSASWFLNGWWVSLGFAVAPVAVVRIYGMWTHGAVPFIPPLFAALAGAVVVRQWATPMSVYIGGLNRLFPQTIAAVIRAASAFGCAALLLPIYGVAGASLGLLIGEILAAGVMLAATSHLLRGIGGEFPWRSAVLALAQISLTAVPLGLFAWGVNGLAPWVVSACVGISFITFWQWRELPADVGTRMAASANSFLAMIWRTPVSWRARFLSYCHALAGSHRNG